MADPAKLLSETIAGYEGGPAPTLPPLRSDPSWWEQEWARWDRWVNEWWASRLKNVRVPGTLSEAVPYVCAALVAGIALWVLVRWWLNRPVDGTRGFGGLATAPGGGDPLALALSAGRYGEAARLRWKRFLFYRRYAPPTTPREASLEIAALSADLDSVERLLFGDPGPTAEAYRQWDERLTRWEGPA